ncbi:hypothetical protein AB0K15_00735, partial [Amycolatopsis sp. NPDC049253]|uniref:hypothetical protein n=1 Tax=Amycolatopsis sp. NPDC049253 TaxID=3155274 RepID=UPI00342A09AF
PRPADHVRQPDLIQPSRPIRLRNQTSFDPTSLCKRPRIDSPEFDDPADQPSRRVSPTQAGRSRPPT